MIHFYVTPEEYAQAEKNGVDSQSLDRRIRLLGWKKEKAISTPLRKQKDRTEWAAVAAENGIRYQTFMSRVLIYKMTEEEAATRPLQDKKQSALINAEKIRKLPKEWVEIARDHGIKYATFRDRVKKGMDYEKAATMPLMTKTEIGRKGAAAYEKEYGRFQVVFQ